MNSGYRALPPLDALKGFEAAARHLSFTRAAAELFLTQSAISRQIQALESHLGVRLFERQTRRLALTPEGERFQRVVTEALDRLTAACAELKSAQRRPRVTITAFVGIASLWLVPRLAAFQAVEPELDVLISADNRVADLEREGIDLALRMMPPERAPAGATLLFDEVIFPVASPAVAAQFPDGFKVEALPQHTLLAFDDAGKTPWLSWDFWLQAQGLAPVRPKAVLQFNQYDQLIRAAVDGRGIAIGRGALTTELIAQGLLVPLSEARQRVAARAYYLVRSTAAARPEVARFADWLVGEARATRADAGL
jgi:DNA-binding transcriptional LysR family regulator